MTTKNEEQGKTWHRILEKDELPEGRVRSVSCGRKTLCMTHHEGEYGALDNHCPHQGGPLGEGSIENGLLRCPWHGWDYHPIDGKAPGYDDGVETHAVEVRDDGVWVLLEDEVPPVRTVSDVMAETLVAGDRDRARALVEGTRLFTTAVSFGATTSSIGLPCAMSHASVPAGSRHNGGLRPDLVRLSVGLEHPGDLLADLKRALTETALQPA